MKALSRRALPVLLLLAIVSELVVGLVGSARIRADDRRAEAIRAERRAVATYRRELQPVALQVFDAVQPLQDADDRFAVVQPGSYDARDDVLAHSGAVARLVTARMGAAALTVPKSLRSKGSGVLTSLDRLAAAARLLAGATSAKGDKTGYVAEYNTGFESLVSAENLWVDAMTGVYGIGHTPPTPAAERATTPHRTSPTKGAFLAQADLICARAFLDVGAIGHVTSLADIIGKFPKSAAVDRRLAARLKAVRSDAAAAPFLHQLHLELAAQDAFPASLLALAAAAKKGDLPAYQRGERQLARATLTLRDLSRSFKSYGATVCSSFYDVDALLAPKGGKSTLSA